MKKEISFGKIAFYGNRKINLVTVIVELNEKKGKKTFSACGYIWNKSQTDCITCGQCLDTIHEYLKGNELFEKIYRLWKLYHLNDMHAGTKAQEECLKHYFDEHRETDYSAQCNYLEKHNLLVDNGYEYGTAWLIWEIPEEDLKEIESLFVE